MKKFDFDNPYDFLDWLFNVGHEEDEMESKNSINSLIVLDTSNKYAIIKDDTKLTVALNYCGCSKSDLDMSICGNIITVVAKPYEFTNKNIISNFLDDFKKSTRIVCNDEKLDIEKTSATMSEGLLFLDIPLKKSESPKTIKIS